MMYPIVLSARNVNGALTNGLRTLASEAAVAEQTRNGPVRSWDGLVVTHTLRPEERVLFSPLRDANPFFHLFESLWMLAGCNDLPWLAQFNKQMASYSDDGGKTQPGAYGHRWRFYFGYDQLDAIIEELTKHPDTRRAVLSMWDGWGIHQLDDINQLGDLHGALAGSKDVPCNTHCYFRIKDGAMHMTVCCRSNDAVWGAHGANAVHFSVLLEYMATRAGLRVGTMTQVSNNYHVYTDVVKRSLLDLAHDAEAHDYYVTNEVTTTPIFTSSTMEQFEDDLLWFINYAAPGQDRSTKPELIMHPFLRWQAIPMLCAWDQHKLGDYDAALSELSKMPDHGTDWFKACWSWLLRRRAGAAAGYKEEAVNA